MQLKKEAKIGAIVLLALLAGYLMLNFLKGINVFHKQDLYYTSLENLHDISVSTPVKINGYQVGSVRKIAFDFKTNKGATITLALDPGVILTEGTTVHIKTNPLTGSELSITPPQELNDQRIMPGGMIPAGADKPDIMEMATKTFTPIVTEIIPKISAILNRLNELSQSKEIDKLMASLAESSHHIEMITANIAAATKSLPKTMAHVDETTASLSKITGQVASANIDSVLLGLSEAAASLNAVTCKLKEKDNTVGLLLNDTGLYQRLDSLTRTVEGLITDVKEHPKRYLKFSVF